MARAKSLRQKAILQIIQEKPVSTQEELVDELRKLGFQASQATLSKDIRELGLVKVPTADGRFRYTDRFRSHIETPAQILTKRLQESVVGYSTASHILVLRTLPGYAPSIAYELDRSNWEEIVGTIAGDDTVFIALASQKDAKSLEKKLNEILSAAETEEPTGDTEEAA